MVACTNSQLLQDELLCSSRAMNNTKLTAMRKKTKKEQSCDCKHSQCSKPLTYDHPKNLLYIASKEVWS